MDNVLIIHLKIMIKNAVYSVVYNHKLLLKHEIVLFKVLKTNNKLHDSIKESRRRLLT